MKFFIFIQGALGRWEKELGKRGKLPIKVQERVSKKLSYMYRAHHHNELGQNRFEWKFLESEDMTTSEQSVTIKSKKECVSFKITIIFPVIMNWNKLLIDTCKCSNRRGF